MVGRASAGTKRPYGCWRRPHTGMVCYTPSGYMPTHGGQMRFILDEAHQKGSNYIHFLSVLAYSFQVRSASKYG